jgi:hypothetical protein
MTEYDWFRRTLATSADLSAQGSANPDTPTTPIDIICVRRGTGLPSAGESAAARIGALADIGSQHAEVMMFI